MRPREEGDALFAGAVACRRRGQSDEAARLSRQCLDVDPTHARAWVLAAVLAGARGETGPALAGLRRAAVLRPDLADAYFAHAHALAPRLDPRPSWQALRRAYVAAPGDRRLFRQAPRPPLLPRRLTAGLTTPGQRDAWSRLHVRWHDEDARRLLIAGFLGRADQSDAAALMRALLIDAPAEAWLWLRLAEATQGCGDVRGALRARLRGGIADGFAGETALAALFFQVRRAHEPLARYEPYFRDHARRSAVNMEIVFAVWRGIVYADPGAGRSDAGVREAASRLGRVAEARRLRVVAYGSFGDAPTREIADAEVTIDPLSARLIAGGDQIVADHEAAALGGALPYVRFAGEGAQHIDEAFLLGMSRNHYDFLAEGTRALRIYLEAGVDLPFLTYGPKPTPVQRELFALLGLEGKALPWLRIPCRVACRRLVITPHVFKASGFEEAHLRWLSSLVLDAVPHRRRRDAPERLFVSRRDSPRRRVANEDEIAAALEARGFSMVTLSDKGLLDQAALFAGARVVVIARGAGPVNIVFCAPGTRVVELSPAPPDDFHHYEHISRFFGLDYHRLHGAAPAGTPDWDNRLDVPRRFDVARVVDLACRP